MDPRMLAYYNRELQFLRELGAEFAAEHPKIAHRLDLRGFECGDPYVERLLEGVAFLAARVHLKLDAEYPRLTQSLLEILYPHYLAPTPSMAVVQLEPSRTEGSLAEGFRVPRDTSLRSVRGKGDVAPCEFRTAHDLDLWPIEIAGVSYGPYSREMGGDDASAFQHVRAALRVRLRATAGLTFEKIAADRLVFHLRGSGELPMRLYEQIFAAGLGAVIRPVRDPGAWRERLGRSSIERVGFADEESLIPYGARSFQGHRLLHEYFAFPERFLFFGVSGLGAAFRRCNEPEVELILPFARSDASLDNAVDASILALHCTPAVNLFPLQADTIHLDESRSEHHVVPDRTRPLDLEVYDVLEARGTGSAGQEDRLFRPFYRLGDRESGAGAYFTTHRVPRALSEAQKRKGTRSTYVGSEVFLSLVDAEAAPYRTDLKQLHLKVRCTNRDLPQHLPVGQSQGDFTLQIGAPVDAVRCVAGPSDPRPSFAEGEYAWRLISHLSLNYLSLVDVGDGRGTDALRELLALYSPMAGGVVQKQIEGLRAVRSSGVVRRIRGAGPIAFGRGIEIELTFDDGSFTGSGPFLLGAVLEEFFARYVSINGFTETVVRTVDRGEIIRWPARAGRRHAL